LKFGILTLKAASQGIQFDYFATGHYARIDYEENRKRFLLKKALDKSKDQSYFLALLSREQIARSLFPLANLKKTEVRNLASGFGFDVSEKADSQDFYTGSYDSLLGQSTPGVIIDKNGIEIGRHIGIGLYTIGQRKGLGIAREKPLYVTKIDPVTNTIVVGERDEILDDKLVASNLNWISVDNIQSPTKLMARIRYRHEEAEALVTPIEVDKVLVRFTKPQMAVTPGQTVVFYDNDIVVGGGVIEKAGGG
jgi:tRNA-specific 2-thiouridylase